MQSRITHTHRHIEWHKEAQLALLIFLLLLLNGITGISAMAEEPAPAHHVGGASPTNPVAPILQMQFENDFIPSSANADGYANQLDFQPVIPYKLWGQPIISRRWIRQADQNQGRHDSGSPKSHNPSPPPSAAGS